MSSIKIVFLVLLIVLLRRVEGLEAIVGIEDDNRRYSLIRFYRYRFCSFRFFLFRRRTQHRGMPYPADGASTLFRPS